VHLNCQISKYASDFRRALTVSAELNHEGKRETAQFNGPMAIIVRPLTICDGASSFGVTLRPFPSAYKYVSGYPVREAGWHRTSRVQYSRAEIGSDVLETNI
jgi:hypothetical protein